MRHGLMSLLVSFLTGLINPVSSQQHIFKNYTANEGLLPNRIRQVFQDSKGFLWIGTWEGLCKYDGNQFTSYSTAQGLTNNLINDFYESNDGTLYVATNGGGIDRIGVNSKISKGVSLRSIVNRFLSRSNQEVIVTTDDDGLYEFREGKLIKPVQPFLHEAILIVSG